MGCAKHQRLRVPDAALNSISAFTRVFDTLWAVHRRAWTQNRENNPMQSRMDPRSAAFVVPCAGGTIPLWKPNSSSIAVMPGLSRPSTFFLRRYCKDVDARDEPGHDEAAALARHPLWIPEKSLLDQLL